MRCSTTSHPTTSNRGGQHHHTYGRSPGFLMLQVKPRSPTGCHHQGYRDAYVDDKARPSQGPYQTRLLHDHHVPPTSHHSALAVIAACITAIEGRSGRPRCVSMTGKELRHTPGFCPATPLAAGGGGVLGRRGLVWKEITMAAILMFYLTCIRHSKCTCPDLGVVQVSDEMNFIGRGATFRASLIRRISNYRNRNINRNLVGMQVTNCKENIPSKKRKNEVRLNCFLGLFCIGIWFQRKISYRFSFMYSYESNAARVQIPIGIEILYFSFKIPINQRRQCEIARRPPPPRIYVRCLPFPRRLWWGSTFMAGLGAGTRWSRSIMWLLKGVIMTLCPAITPTRVIKNQRLQPAVHRQLGAYSIQKTLNEYPRTHFQNRRQHLLRIHPQNGSMPRSIDLLTM
jgi:hypothetical protein